ncbi:MAG: hypothetical protein LBQ62_04140 [Candidatus Accumulibacter sp.]|jgi:hypothetical protein|nr:hypothetical protein [Accumulibacter sp.]
MSKTWKILTGFLLVVVIAQGAGLVYLWRSVQPVRVDAPPSPLLSPGRAAPPNVAPVARPDAQRVERMRRLQQRLRELTANGRKPTPMELDPILQELTEIQGSTRIAGMDIQALRDNLKVADRIQKLAQELEAEARKPQAQRDNAKIQRLQAAILREQRALRMDFMADNVTRRQAEQ